MLNPSAVRLLASAKGTGPAAEDRPIRRLCMCVLLLCKASASSNPRADLLLLSSEVLGGVGQISVGEEKTRAEHLSQTEFRFSVCISFHPRPRLPNFSHFKNLVKSRTKLQS